MARFINLLGADGIRPKSGDVVVIIHGAAAPLALADSRYAERNKGAGNPNLSLMAALRTAGVSVRVCSQALVGNRIDPVDVADGIDAGVSALTALATLQTRGWALTPG